MRAPDWLHKSEQPIRSQVSKLAQLLTMTTTHKFPPLPVLQGHVRHVVDGRVPALSPDSDIFFPMRVGFLILGFKCSS